MPPSPESSQAASASAHSPTRDHLLHILIIFSLSPRASVFAFSPTVDDLDPMSDLLTTYTQLPSDDVTATHTALVIHGILGSRRNWQSYVRRLLDAHPEWRFVLVDLRNHGDAPAASPPHTLHACADDLRRLMDHLGLRPDVVMGHSFGGKVALAYGEQYPDHVDEIWVLDATPGPRCPGAQWRP